MPCLNVDLDGVDTSAILAEASKTVASVIGKPEAVSSPPSSPCPSFLLIKIHSICFSIMRAL
jgi:hypothetical protein